MDFEKNKTMWKKTDNALLKAKKYYAQANLKGNKKINSNNSANAQLTAFMQNPEFAINFEPFKYMPFTKTQAKVLTWWQKGSPKKNMDGIIADGSIRSGKSLCLSLSFCLWAMESFNMQNFALCGKTVGSLRRNVLTLLKHMLRGRGYAVKERRTDNLLIVSKNGVCNRFYLFGGKDESSADLIQGITLAGILFDEVALMPESFVNQATARCSVQGSKWWFSCNPQGPNHWFYTNWVLQKKEKNLLYVHFTMQDNPSLTKQMIQRYENMYTGVFYERYVKGLWVAAQGLVYPMVAQQKSKFVLQNANNLNGRFFISIDYGTRNPFSMGLWCVNGNTAVRVKEFYHNSVKEQRQLTDEEYYEQLDKFAKGYLIQRVVIDPSAASFIQTIRKHAFFTVRSAENSVLDGIRVTASLTGKDEVIKQNDHAMDDMRYFCATILAREFKWIEWR